MSTATTNPFLGQLEDRQGDLKRLGVQRIGLFGSCLRGDQRPDSDVDVLVTFDPDAQWSLFDHATMQDALSDLLGRKVDLISRRAIERSKNWMRRQAILDSAEPFYVAG